MIPRREQAITPGLCVLKHPRVVPGRDAVGTDSQRRRNELLELDLGVTEAAGDRSIAREVLLHKGTHHALLELLLEIHHVIRDAQEICHSASVVYVVKRAAAAAGVTGCGGTLLEALQPRQPPLIPQLHRESDHLQGIVGTRRNRSG